jgi:hypothetical protein
MDPMDIYSVQINNQIVAGGRRQYRADSATGGDVELDYHHRFDAGWQFKSNATWTYIHEYKMTIDGR